MSKKILLQTQNGFVGQMVWNQNILNGTQNCETQPLSKLEWGGTFGATEILVIYKVTVLLFVSLKSFLV